MNTFGAEGLLSRSFANASTFYAFDERGDVAQRLNGAGSVTSADLYDGYGKRLAGGASGDPWGFGAQAGYYTDGETGLVLLTHRFYDPAQGRFLTRDPIGYGGGVNLYGYTQNNPVNRMDPSGFFGWGDVLDILGNGLSRGISIGGSGWFVTAGGGFDVGIASDQSGTVGITYDYWGGSGLGEINLGGSVGASLSPGSLGKPDQNGTVQSSGPFHGGSISLPTEPIGGGSFNHADAPNSYPTLQLNTPGRPWYGGATYGHTGFFGINPWAALSSLFTGASCDPFVPGDCHPACKQ